MVIGIVPPFLHGDSMKVLGGPVAVKADTVFHFIRWYSPAPRLAISGRGVHNHPFPVLYFHGGSSDVAYNGRGRWRNRLQL
jgi:hypothetical protein